MIQVRKQYDIFAGTSGGGTGLGQYSFGQGTNSTGWKENDPFSLDEVVIKPTSTSTSNGSNSWLPGLLSNLPGTIASIGNLFPNSRATPTYVINDSGTPPASSGNSTWLIVGGIAVALVLFLLISKK